MKLKVKNLHLHLHICLRLWVRSCLESFEEDKIIALKEEGTNKRDREEIEKKKNN
ncbi:MAG: hypothetical protein GY816_18985 [Cytophagales bacterium]|nr:hypothetical protein [Cytophagales bacterium]